MKRFWLFGGDAYYPGGGAEDFLSAHAEFSEAILAGNDFLDKGGALKWVHILDTDIVADPGFENPIAWSANSEERSR